MGENRGFDFRHFWHSLLEKLWIVALCVLAGLFLALGYLARTPKVYQGHIVLEVDFQEPTMIAGENPSSRMRSAFLASENALRTIEQKLVNRALMARVIRAEGLASDGGQSLLGESVIQQRGSPLPTAAKKVAASDELSSSAFTPLEEALGGALSTMVEPVIRKGTRLIDVYVQNRDPELAQRLADAVGREYIRSSIERRSTFSHESLRYLMEEEERLKKSLQKSEAAVAEYKAKTPDALQLGGGAAATGSQAGAGSSGSSGGLVEQRLQELSSKLAAAKSERARLEGELQQIEQMGEENIEALLAVPSIAAAAPVNDRRRDVAQLEAGVATLEQRYKNKHPKMMAARAALLEATDALRRAVLAQPAVLRNTLEQARAVERNSETSRGEQEKAALALNKAAIGYQELARQAETDRALYESVLRQIKETNLTKDVKTNAATIIQSSALPRVPVSPKPFLTVALGLAGGLAAALGLVFALDALDRSIKTVDQAESIFGLPVLSAIPETRGGSKAPSRGRKEEEVASSELSVAQAPQGPVAESITNQRASLSLMGPETERKVFLFTSALPAEGKSFTSANYALALAQQGHRVLLIDGDLRRPSLHKVFSNPDDAGAKRDESFGVVDYLVGGTSLENGIQSIAADTFNILPSGISDRGQASTAMGGQLFLLAGGQRAPNPAELLSGASFARLVADASAHFDRVVIDSAPILAVSDTILMTPYVHTVCMVVRAAKTPRNAVHRAISLLATASGLPAGLILNRLPHRRGAGYYYYYASPGYGKGEGAYAGHYGSNGATKDG